MEITFDSAKDIKKKRTTRAYPSQTPPGSIGGTLTYAADDRFDYGPVRHRGLGYISDRLHQFGFTVEDDVFRVISLRKANRREVKAYEQGRAAT